MSISYLVSSDKEEDDSVLELAKCPRSRRDHTCGKQIDISMDPAPVSNAKVFNDRATKHRPPGDGDSCGWFDHGEGRDPLDQLGIVPKDVVWSIVRDWTDRKVTG